jgi:hypothetical protein
MNLVVKFECEVSEYEDLGTLEAALSYAIIKFRKCLDCPDDFEDLDRDITFNPSSFGDEMIASADLAGEDDES